DVTIGVVNAADTLTLSAPVGQSSGSFGLKKAGLGRLTLGLADTYSGASTATVDTTILAGTLRIQNGASLGGNVRGTQVKAGAVLEIDGNPLNRDTVTFTPGSGAVTLAYGG